MEFKLNKKESDIKYVFICVPGKVVLMQDENQVVS